MLSYTGKGGSTGAPAITVPFVDLRPGHEQVESEILADIAELLQTGAFTNGPAVARFESAFARYCRSARCVGTGSGLDALRLILIALDLEPGDEVIVPAQTFVATYEAVTQAGGRPVAVDISERDYNVDIAAVEAAITPKTRAIMPVHLYGQLADMRVLRAIARASRSSRTPARPTARPATAFARAKAAPLQRSASIRARTSERSATAAR